MTVRFRCKCGARLEHQEQYLGMRMTCPECGGEATIRRPTVPERMGAGSLITVGLVSALAVGAIAGGVGFVTGLQYGRRDWVPQSAVQEAVGEARVRWVEDRRRDYERELERDAEDLKVARQQGREAVWAEMARRPCC